MQGFEKQMSSEIIGTDITLPDSYVNAASLKLLKYAIAFIDKNDHQVSVQAQRYGHE